MKDYEKKIKEHQILFADGFDQAIVGIDMDTDLPRVIYSKEMMIAIIAEEIGEEDAIDFLQYNVWGAYVGTGTPMYINTGNREEVERLAEDWEADNGQ